MAMARDEKAKLFFLDWQDVYNKEKPYQLIITEQEQIDDKFQDTNLVFTNNYAEQTIGDIRGREAEFSLDKNGFAVVTQETAVTFENEQEIDDVYIPEIEKLMAREVDGADRVVVFDWRIRRNDRTSQLGKSVNINNRMNHLLPAQNVHVDQSPATVLKRIRLHFKNEAESLLKGRVRVINAWRPLYNPVEDWPLVLCDGSSADEGDLIYTDHIRRHHAGEVLYAKYNKNNKWYYLNQQSNDEVILVKNFDSDLSAEAKYCPHASFKHANIRRGAPTRESIEVRAFVFTIDEEKAGLKSANPGKHIGQDPLKSLRGCYI